MSHYVCKGECGGVADESGVCRADNCSRKNSPLSKCECEDDRHEPVLEEDVEEDESPDKN